MSLFQPNLIFFTSHFSLSIFPNLLSLRSPSEGLKTWMKVTWNWMHDLSWPFWKWIYDLLAQWWQIDEKNSFRTTNAKFPPHVTICIQLLNNISYIISTRSNRSIKDNYWPLRAFGCYIQVKMLLVVSMAHSLLTLNLNYYSLYHIVRTVSTIVCIILCGQYLL